MDNKKFNLVTDPWIKVITKKNKRQKTVSLLNLFDNAEYYQQLAGETRTQDLAIMRFLLAILTTVYSRTDWDGDPYDWLDVDLETFKIGDDVIEGDQGYAKDGLLKTWEELYDYNYFTPVVLKYLKRYADRFNFFGDHPFYQVTEYEFNSLVPANKKIHGAEGPGQVAVKQINRTISESGHTPDLFSPKSDDYKNDMPLDELVRWVITYQNISGANDKTKIESAGKTSAGWLYNLYPIFAQGNSLFQTLMLNLVMKPYQGKYAKQKPVWEYDTIQDYVTDLQKLTPPDNTAALYTNWSRLLHIRWDDNGQPTIFSAKLPAFQTSDVSVEPMTVWKPDDDGGYKPAVAGLEAMDRPLWLRFNQIFDPEDTREPGVIAWLKLLHQQEGLSETPQITLAASNLVFNRSNPANMASQMPDGEYYHDITINTGVIFNPDWVKAIGQMVKLNYRISIDYKQFIVGINQIRYAGDNQRVQQISNRKVNDFYRALDKPFKNWLEDLNALDQTDKKTLLWKKRLRKIALETLNDVLAISSPRDKQGIIKAGKTTNIFTLSNQFKHHIFDITKK